MVFSTLDEGPFWMSHEEREKKRHNEIIQGQTVKRKLTKKELQELLLTKGITIKGRLVDLQMAAINHSIAIEHISNKVIEG
jgi:hypothetical protein